MASRLKWIHFGCVASYPASLLVHLGLSAILLLLAKSLCGGRAEVSSLCCSDVCCSLTSAPTRDFHSRP